MSGSDSDGCAPPLPNLLVVLVCVMGEDEGGELSVTEVLSCPNPEDGVLAIPGSLPFPEGTRIVLLEVVVLPPVTVPEDAEEIGKLGIDELVDSILPVAVSLVDVLGGGSVTPHGIVPTD